MEKEELEHLKEQIKEAEGILTEIYDTPITSDNIPITLGKLEDIRSILLLIREALEDI